MLHTQSVVLGSAAGVIVVAALFIVQESGLIPGIRSGGSSSSAGDTAEFREQLRKQEGLIKELRDRINYVQERKDQYRKKWGTLLCKTQDAITGTGAWCADKEGKYLVHHKFDAPLGAALDDLFAGATVGDLGAGPGHYTAVFRKNGRVKAADAYDGALGCDEATGGLVKYLDLSERHWDELPTFDWVLSLEVGEHIPKEFEGVYFDNIVGHARVGLVLSWALPNQGGHGHVNEKPNAYVEEQLKARGWALDAATAKKLRGVATLWWFKNTIMVFRPVAAAPAGAADSPPSQSTPPRTHQLLRNVLAHRHGSHSGTQLRGHLL